MKRTLSLRTRAFARACDSIVFAFTLPFPIQLNVDFQNFISQFARLRGLGYKTQQKHKI